MSLYDLNNNGIDDIVEDQIRNMEMGNRPTPPVATSFNHQTNSNNTNNFTNYSSSSTFSVFGLIKDSIKYSSKKGKKAMIIAAIAFSAIGIFGMCVAMMC